MCTVLYFQFQNDMLQEYLHESETDTLVKYGMQIDRKLIVGHGDIALESLKLAHNELDNINDFCINEISCMDTIEKLIEIPNELQPSNFIPSTAVDKYTYLHM